MPVELQPSRSRSRVQFPPGRKACSSVDRAGCFTIPRRRSRSRLIATSGECRRDYRLERPFIRKGGRRFRWRPAQAVAQQSSPSNLVAVLDRKDFDTSRRMPMGIQCRQSMGAAAGQAAPDSPLSGAHSHPSRRRGPSLERHRAERRMPMELHGPPGSNPEPCARPTGPARVKRFHPFRRRSCPA